jgi:hypothetical protein
MGSMPQSAMGPARMPLPHASVPAKEYVPEPVGDNRMGEFSVLLVLRLCNNPGCFDCTPCVHLGELAVPVALAHVLRRSDPKAAPPPWIGKKESFTPYVNKNKPKRPRGRPPLPPQHELMGGFQIQRPPVHIQMAPFAMPGGMPHPMPGGMPQPGIVRRLSCAYSLFHSCSCLCCMCAATLQHITY